MKASRTRAAAALLFGALLAPSAQAIQLNLDKATELALQADPRIDEQRAYKRKAEALLQEAEGSAGWRFDLTSFAALTTGVDGGFYEGGAESCSSNCKPRDDAYDLDQGLSLWAGLTFSIVKPLTTFGLLENYQQAAEQNIVVQQQQVRLQRDVTRRDVAKAYYGYLAARDGRLLMEDTEKRLQSALDLVKQWLDEDNGQAKLSDRYALEAGLALVQRYRSEAEGLEAIALAGLRMLTGLGKDEKIEIEDRRLSPEALPDRPLQQWIETALVQRAEMKQVEAGLAARRALVEAKKASAKPIVFAGVAGSMAWSPDRESLDNPFLYDPFNHVAASPLIGLRWQWESGAQPARVEQARADLDALVSKAALARQGIPFQVAEQYHLVQSKFRAQQQMRESALAARRWMIAAYSDFEAGLEKAEKILTAMQAYVLAYGDYLKLVNEYNNHLVQLKSVSGVYE